MKLSIIIPIYNPGKYFEECIESVLKQTYTDWELLLVDDGSDDGTEDKCIEYAASDNRIRVLHSNHGGVSHARNVGISASVGEFLLFMDNDDYWKEDTLLQNVAEQIEIQKADVIMYSCAGFWPDGRLSKKVTDVDKKRIDSDNKADTIKYIVQKDILTRAVWTKAIRRDLIIKHDLCFPEGKRNEDVYFTGRLILYANKFGWCDNATYMYRKGTGVSQSDQKVSDKTIEDLQKICIEYINFVNKNVKNEELRDAYTAYISYPYAVWMMYVGRVKNQNLRSSVQLMKKYSYVLDNRYSPYIKQVRICKKIFGYNATIKLLAVYDKLRKYLI